MVATSKHNAVKNQSFQSVASFSHVLSGGSLMWLLRRLSFTGEHRLPIEQICSTPALIEPPSKSAFLDVNWI
jgi:hypothetical protein